MMEPSRDNNFSKKLAQFDAFPKVEEGYTKGTESGGMVTTLVALVVTFLFFSESLHYMRVNQEYEFLVDPTIQRNMLLNFDLTVNTACNFLNVDIHDASHNSLHLTDKIKLVPTIFELKKAKSLEDNLNQAYNNKAGRVVGLAGKKKVVDLNQLKHKKQTGDNTACRIYGTFEVKKLQGNFHITPLGHGHGGHHVDHSLMNFTHRIDTLSFGKHFPKLVNPLDNSYSIVKESMEQHKYFISVVPTTYVNRHSQSVNSNQYSVNDFSTEAEPQFGVFPGIFFKYDIEPLMVKITEKKQSLITFLVRLCGIIGGIYVSSGLLHRVALNMVSLSQDKEVKRSISSVYSNEKRI